MPKVTPVPAPPAPSASASGRKLSERGNSCMEVLVQRSEATIAAALYRRLAEIQARWSRLASIAPALRGGAMEAAGVAGLSALRAAR